MKLNLEQIDVASFPTTAVPVVPAALPNTGEDCYSFRVCWPTTFTTAA